MAELRDLLQDAAPPDGGRLDLDGLLRRADRRRRHRRVGVAALVLVPLAALGAAQLNPVAEVLDRAPAGAVDFPVEAAAEVIGKSARQVTVVVLDRGAESVATAGHAPTGRDTPVRVADVTGVLTAVITAQLIDEGRLDLDDTLEDHVPGVVPGGDDITVQHLLEHRSGLVNVIWRQPDIWLDPDAVTDPRETLRLAGEMPLGFDPGTLERPSLTNYIALGLIIEAVTGRSYAAELDSRILGPLGLTEVELVTTRHVPDIGDEGANPGALWAAAGAVATAHDLAKIFSALMSGQLLADHWLDVDRPSRLGMGAVNMSCGWFFAVEGQVLSSSATVMVRRGGDRVAVITRQGGAGLTPGQIGDLVCPSSLPTVKL